MRPCATDEKETEEEKWPLGCGDPTCEEVEPSVSAWGRQSPEWGRNPGKGPVFTA